MLCLLLVGRKKERERERRRNRGGKFFPQDWTVLADYANQNFYSCNLQLKADLRVSL
jgi:hypothetical protein